MDSLGEILHLCRLCLVKDHVNIPIFDDPGNIRQIPLKISSCLPVQISRNDNLPKKICDGCSEKLDLCYEFWNSSAIAEKKLLSMVAEKENQIVEPPVPQPILMKAELVSMDNITSEQVAEEESQSEPLVPQPIVVKQEAEVLDTFESSVERTEETEAPPSKRPRRSAAIKAQKNIVPESDDDDDEGAATEDINSEEPLTKEEPYVDEDIHTEVPDMSVDDAQPGTSGLNQGMEDSTTLQCKRSKEYECGYCYNTFKYSTALKEHVALKHTHEYRFKCQHCDRGFYLASRKRMHVKRYHEKPAKEPDCSYKCDECNKHLANKQSLNLHRDVVHHRTERFFCEHCGKGFPLRGYLVQHQKVNHFQVDDKPFECPEPNCKRRFRTKHTCLTHQLTHNPDRKFECLVCSKVYIHLLSFKKHLREHEKGKKGFRCELCDRVLSSGCSLRDHLKTHSGEKPVHCPHCPKSFVNKKHLKVHIVVHTKEKNYECRICGKKYTQRGTLRGHFLKNHPEEQL